MVDLFNDDDDDDDGDIFKQMSFHTDTHTASKHNAVRLFSISLIDL